MSASIMRPRAGLAVVLLLVGVGLSETARPCSVDVFATGGALADWKAASLTLDDFMAEQWCGFVSGDAVLVEDDAYRHDVAVSVPAALNIGVDTFEEKWQAQADQDLNGCNPDAWYIRFISGAYFMQYLAQVRAADVVTHAEQHIVLLDGVIDSWLDDWVGVLAENGFDRSCDRKSSSGGGTTFATNPAGDDPITLWGSWFYVKGVVERAGTLVHEATHERVSHVCNDGCDGVCANKGSCDQGFAVENPDSEFKVNAQTAQILFLTHAVDAYRPDPKDSKVPLFRRAPQNFGEPAIANDGAGTCFYVPFLPPAVRDAAVQEGSDKLKTTFVQPPAPATWPLAMQPKDADGNYPIDVANGARWPCDKVCDVDDYTAGKKGCDETYQSANVAINLANRNACATANNAVAGGVTPTRRAELAASFVKSLKACKTGVSQSVIDAHCATAIGKATTMSDVETAWDIPAMAGFEPTAAIAACEERFCKERATYPQPDLASAADACYELDLSDPVTGCPDPCGSFHVGLPEDVQFERAACHYTRVTGQEPPGAPSPVTGYGDDAICAREVLACHAADMVADWLAAREAGECWFGTPTHGLPSSYGAWTTTSALGLVDFTTFDAMAAKDAIAQDPCALIGAACMAVHSVGSKLATDVAAGLIKKPGYGLDDGRAWMAVAPAGGLDTPLRGFVRGVAASTGESVRSGAARLDIEVQRVANDPDTLVALAGIIGDEGFVQIVGAEQARGLIAATTIADATTKSVDLAGFEADVRTLQAARDKLASPGFRAALSAGWSATSLRLLYPSIEAIANAEDASGLASALNQLESALAGLR